MYVCAIARTPRTFMSGRRPMPRFQSLGLAFVFLYTLSDTCNTHINRSLLFFIVLFNQCVTRKMVLNFGCIYMLILFFMMLFLHCLTTIFIRSGMKEYLVLAILSMHGRSFLKCKGIKFFVDFYYEQFDDKTGHLIWEMFTLSKGVPNSFEFVLFLIKFITDCSVFQCTSYLLRSTYFSRIQSGTMTFLKMQIGSIRSNDLVRFIFARMRIQMMQNAPLPELRGPSCLEGGRCLDSKAYGWLLCFCILCRILVIHI